MTLKQRTGILKIPLGVGFGGGEARKCFVKEGDDSLLFGKWGDRDCQAQHLLSRNAGDGGSG